MIPIALIDDAVFRRSLYIALDNAGFPVHECADLVAWARTPGRRAAVVTARSEGILAAVTQCCRLNPNLIIVLIAEDPSEDFMIEALQAGATALVDARVSFDEFARVLRAALRGETLIASDIVRHICRRVKPPNHVSMPKREVLWLTALARGATVTQIADESGYSEREMYRLLHRAYQRLGASTRTQALLQAATFGFLDQSLLLATGATTNGDSVMSANPDLNSK